MIYNKLVKMKSVSYHKVCYSKQKVVEQMFGSRESDFQWLPHLVIAICQSNPGTVFYFEWKRVPTETGVVVDKLFGHLVCQLKVLIIVDRC